MICFCKWRLQVCACRSFGWSCLILADLGRSLEILADLVRTLCRVKKKHSQTLVFEGYPKTTTNPFRKGVSWLVGFMLWLVTVWMEIWFWGQAYGKKSSWCCGLRFFFGSVGRNCINKQAKGLVFSTMFIPFGNSWVPRGIWKLTKITTSWKHANPNTNKMKNRKFFECVAILLKTGGLNGCTFTVVWWKRGVKKVRLYI